MRKRATAHLCSRRHNAWITSAILARGLRRRATGPDPATRTTNGRLLLRVGLSLIIGLSLALVVAGGPQVVGAVSCSQVLINSDMEATSGWQRVGGPPIPEYDTAQAHSPTHSMRLGIIGGPNTFSFSTITQDFVLPANAVSAQLTWWAWPRLESAGENDFQELLLQEASTGSTLSALWRVQQNDRAWISLTRDLMPFKGQTLRLFFNVRNDGIGSFAGMYIDDVALVICLADTPTPGPGGSLTGKVFVDTNSNGVLDPGESGFPNLPVSVAPGGTQLTNGAGQYDFGTLAAGSYTVSTSPPPGYTNTSSTSVPVTISASPVTVNFGIIPVSGPTATPTPFVITATPTPTPIVVTNTPPPIVVTNTPTPTPIIVTNTPTPTPAVVTATPTTTPGFITATPTWTPPGPPTDTPTPIVVTNTPVPPTPFPTATPTPQPTATPLPAGCNEWLENSGFEDPLQLMDPGWWIYPEPLKPLRVQDPKHDGAWSVQLGTKDADAVSFSSVRQQVTIPLNATTADLSWFWWAAGDTTDKGDYQQLILLTPSSTPFHHQVVAVLWDRNQAVADNWQQGKANLLPYRGFTVVIYFNVYNNGNGKRRVMYLDDVKLNVCVPTPVPVAQPAPSDTPIPPTEPPAVLIEVTAVPEPATGISITTGFGPSGTILATGSITPTSGLRALLSPLTSNPASSVVGGLIVILIAVGSYVALTRLRRGD